MDGMQVLGAIIGSAIVRGLTPEDERDDSLLGANVFVRAPGHTKDRAFGGAPLQSSPSSHLLSMVAMSSVNPVHHWLPFCFGSLTQPTFLIRTF
jgi:hypothetical protein